MEKRAANRKVRKSIAIIGEGLTEYRYVDDMRTTERYRFSLVPVWQFFVASCLFLSGDANEVRRKKPEG